MDSLTKIIKSNYLKEGTTIGIISPSSPAAGLFPERIKRAIKYLNQLGFKVKLSEFSKSINGYLSAPAINRSSDLNNMFLDKKIDAIICTIGGDHSCQLLDLIDYEMIKNNPKIFMGYSDITVLLIAIWKMTGLVTFYGPTIMTEFAEYPSPPDYSSDNAINILMDKHSLKIQASNYYINEFISWGTKDDKTRAKKREKSEEWVTINNGVAEGILIGGCIESLQHLRGTKYWPDFENSILFLETSSAEPNIQFLDGLLSDYENMGILKQIKGFIFGRKNWNLESKKALYELIESKLKKYNIPCMANLDFGHISPMFTLPIGCKAKLDCNLKSINLLEKPIQNV